MRPTFLATSALTAILLYPATVQAQQAPAPGEPSQSAQQNTQAPSGQAQQPQQQGAAGNQASAQQPQVAQQCLDDLAALGQQMNEEGYWVTGYRGRSGWGGLGMTGTVPGTAPLAPDTAAEPQTSAPANGGATDRAAPQSPWGNMTWTASPSYEIRILYSSASVLARRGDEEACQAVLAELQDVYGQYVEDLRQAGVEPGAITSWRQEQIVAAQPIAEFGRNVPIDNITGTDVRNAEDEHLGSVEDVVLDPQSGNIAYAVVSRGGFLGIGEDEVAVPWNMLQATPGLNTIVLNIDEQTLESAPEVDPDAFGSEEFSQRRQEIDQFWQQQSAQ